jgi:CubicO group peptidase (beta-lactamase class C family)
MKGMRVMLGAIVGRLCQTPRGQVGVSQKRPTNPMRGIISGVVLNTIAALFAVAQGAAPEGSVKPETSVAGEIDSYLDSLVAENKLSGAVLVARDGVTIASKAAGIANKTTGAPITLNTRFNLGSTNKMFTAVAIAQLAQAGRLSFDDTISKHLPHYPNKVSGVGLYQRRAHEFGPSSDDTGDHGNPAADSAGVTFQETVRRGLTQLRQPRTFSG